MEILRSVLLYLRLIHFTTRDLKKEKEMILRMCPTSHFTDSLSGPTDHPCTGGMLRVAHISTNVSDSCVVLSATSLDTLG